MRTSALHKAAHKIGIPLLDISLCEGDTKNSWINPETNLPTSAEEAVLAKFRMEGWRGYAGEGGLILNLIKSMSFEKISYRHRSTYIEALYAQNVSFKEDRFLVKELLSCVASAKKQNIEENIKIMQSHTPFTIDYGLFKSTSSTSMLDYFPGLEMWMFTELFDVAGNDLLYQVANKFSEDPYEYRRGWPDITMWKNDELTFVEVKAPGDKIRDSQKVIFNEFAKPLGLNFCIAAVNSEVT